MPKFSLRIWSTQTLYDCQDFDVEAETAEEAAAQLDLIQRRASSTGKRQRLPNNIEAVGGYDDLMSELDPEEIIDGESGVSLLDDHGNKLSDVDFEPLDDEAEGV